MVSRSVVVETALHEEDQLGPLVATYQTQATRAGKLTFWGIGLFCLLLVGGIVGLDVWLILPYINDPFFFALLFCLNNWFPDRRPRVDALHPLVAASRAYFARHSHSAQNCGLTL